MATFTRTELEAHVRFYARNDVTQAVVDYTVTYLLGKADVFGVPTHRDAKTDKLARMLITGNGVNLDLVERYLNQF